MVTIATYTYFLIALISNQHVGQLDGGLTIVLDLIPVFTILQFIFYMGWLKVGEALMNPFGDDDDDFEVNSMIDRNLQMGYLIVDEMHNHHPELLKDQYWNGIPQVLPDKVKEEEEDVKNEPMAASDADVVDFEVRRRTTLFGDAVTMMPLTKDYKSDPYTPPYTISIDVLRPDANVIAEVYKNIENVEEEQEEINQAIEIRRRRSIDISALNINGGNEKFY